MGKIVKFVLVVILVVLIWKKGLPWLQSYGFTVPGSGAELNTEGWGCVNRVEDTRDQLGEILTRARPNEPALFLDKLQELQGEAEILCRCEKRGCAEGKEALYVIAETATQVADPGRIGEAALQGARTLEKIDNILERAKAAARSGT